MYFLSVTSMLNFQLPVFGVTWSFRNDYIILTCDPGPQNKSKGPIFRKWDSYIIWNLNKQAFHWCMVCYDRTIFGRDTTILQFVIWGCKKKTKYWENHEFFALVLSVLVFSGVRILVCLAGHDADLALSRAASSLALSFSCLCCSILASCSRLFIRSSSTRACRSASKARLRSWKNLLIIWSHI